MRRQFRSIAIACILSAAALTGAHAADAAPAPGSPEQAVLAPAQALRQNDLLALFKALPADEQKEAEESWAKAQAEPPGESDAKIDQVLKLMALPNAVDVMMLQVEPKLKEINPNELAFQIQMGVGMLGMSLASNPEGAPYAELLQGIATDLVAWLPKAGINDPAKAREALTGVVAAVKAFKVTGAAELKALPLTDLLDRAGAALKELKTGLKAYGCELDPFLESVKVTDVKGEGDKRTATLGFTVLGKPRTLPIKLINKNGRWVGDDSALAATMGGITGGGPGEADPSAPEPVVIEPEGAPVQ